MIPVIALTALPLLAAPDLADVMPQNITALNDRPILNLIGEIEGPDGYIRDGLRNLNR